MRRTDPTMPETETTEEFPIPEGAQAVRMQVGDNDLRVVGWVMPERGTIGELLRHIADETDAIEQEWEDATPDPAR